MHAMSMNKGIFIFLILSLCLVYLYGKRYHKRGKLLNKFSCNTFLSGIIP